MAQHRHRYTHANLGNFDQRPYHFGFTLGFNSADFYLNRVPEDTSFADSLQTLNVKRQPGFNIGIVSSLHINQNLSLRFVPTLSFQNRILHYEFLQSNGKLKPYDKSLQSTYIDFPIHVKFRSDRINNFAVYVIGGAKYSLDMQSRQGVNNKLADDIVVKMNKGDYSAEFGGGFDFFLTYFKFGIELKAAMGIPNVIIHDGTIFSNPIDQLRTKAFFITFTFEG